MIKDADYWRADLLRQARQLDERQKQVRWTHISFTRTEQCVMLGFYSIRKILEAGKVSPQVMRSLVHLTRFGRNNFGKAEVFAPLLKVFYDLEHPRLVQHNIRFVCNQVVHSSVFSIAVSYEAGFAGVYFASERQRNMGLFFLAASELVDVFRRVGQDARAEFCGWVEERLPSSRVQTAFPPPSRFKSTSRKDRRARATPAN